ncbi:MAG: cardiolipin synthase [Pirellulales bacterium]
MSLSFAYYLSEWVIRLTMLVVVTRRREPTASMAWLLVVFFVPWPGLILYWLIGSNRLPRRRIEGYAHVRRRLHRFADRVTEHLQQTRPDLGQEVETVVRLPERLGAMPVIGGNHVELIADTDRLVDQLIADINRAEHHVHVLCYIYADDATGRRVGEALQRAAERGVQCRVLVDAVGSRAMLSRYAHELRHRGVDVRAALPVGLFRKRVARIDVRNHRKVIVVDGCIGYTGSQNIVGADYGTRDLVWYDVMVRLVGPAVPELQAVFITDWYFETADLLDADPFFPAPDTPGDVPLQVIPGGPNFYTENFQRLVVASMYAARHRVCITTPYFVPDEPLIQAIQVAALRNVEVELIVPRRSDHRLVAAASRSYYEQLLEAGVHIHRFTGGLLHAKIISIDDRFALIGSSNLDIRSFELNFEINLVLYDASVALQARRLQERYRDQAVELTRDEWRRRPAWKFARDNLAKLLSPLL